MRETARVIEVAVKDPQKVPGLRATAVFVEVAVKRPQPGGWSVGSIRIA